MTQSEGGLVFRNACEGKKPNSESTTSIVAHTGVWRRSLDWRESWKSTSLENAPLQAHPHPLNLSPSLPPNLTHSNSHSFSTPIFHLHISFNTPHTLNLSHTPSPLTHIQSLSHSLTLSPHTHSMSPMRIILYFSLPTSFSPIAFLPHLFVALCHHTHFLLPHLLKHTPHFDRPSWTVRVAALAKRTRFWQSVSTSSVPSAFAVAMTLVWESVRSAGRHLGPMTSTRYTSRENSQPLMSSYKCVSNVIVFCLVLCRVNYTVHNNYVNLRKKGGRWQWRSQDFQGGGLYRRM